MISILTVNDDADTDTGCEHIFTSRLRYENQ